MTGDETEGTQTVKRDEKKEIYKETDFKEVIQKADELQENYYNKKSVIESENKLPNLSSGTWVTGLASGEIVDMEIDDQKDDLILDVRLSDVEDVHKVRVKDRNTEYTENNELVRLLEYYDIGEGRIERLHGKNINLQVNRYALPSNDWSEMSWKPYIPTSLDSAGKTRHRLNTALRYLGYEGEFQKKSVAVAFLGVSLFWWSVLFGVASTGFLAFNSVPTSYGPVVTLVTIMSLLMTIYTPLLTRIIKINWEKYLEKRKIDNALKQKKED